MGKYITEKTSRYFAFRLLKLTTIIWKHIIKIVESAYYKCYRLSNKKKKSCFAFSRLNDPYQACKVTITYVRQIKV